MWRRTRRLFGNVLLAAISLLACFALLEYGLFKYVLVPDDVTHNVTINNVVRYRPDTRAIFRRPGGTRHLVTINADGWNSTKPHYRVERTPSILRGAVVCDSYAHGAWVNVDEGFPRIIEQQLEARGIRAEGYRCAVDGAPLSQYLHMLRREVVRYRPDVVLFLLIHNDFDESYRLLHGRYASSFLKVRPDGDGGFSEVAPADFVPGFADVARASRSFRYLYYTTGLYKRMRVLVNRLWWGGEAVAETEEIISSAVDIRNIRDRETITNVSRYILREIEGLAARHGFKTAFVMDAVREAVYSGKHREAYEVSALNEIAGGLARELGRPFLDLQRTFADHHARHGKRFEYPWDWHWNRLANRIVGETATELLLRDPRLLGQEIRPGRLGSRRHAGNDVSPSSSTPPIGDRRSGATRH